MEILSWKSTENLTAGFVDTLQQLALENWLGHRLTVTDF